jgi:hypothetical protein
MSDKHFAILRRQMVELIEIQVELISDELGQEALSEQILAAMRRVPRHLFVAPPWPLRHTKTCRFLSSTLAILVFKANTENQPVNASRWGPSQVWGCERRKGILASVL